MTGKTHAAGGVLAAAGVASLGPLFEVTSGILTGELHIAGFTIPAAVGGASICLIASLLPDIDEPESLIVNSPGAMRKQLGRGRGVQERVARGLLGALLLIARRLLRLISGAIRLFAGGHRGATHWLFIAVLLSLGMWYLGGLAGYSLLWIWFAAGYLSHLMLDMMTPSGLEVLRPLTSARMHLLPGFMRIRTGSGVDALVRVALLMGAGALLYQPLFR
jgi:membrane-bound metal-dependent hydrolase YbcI (DUF457 family)